MIVHSQIGGLLEYLIQFKIRIYNLKFDSFLVSKKLIDTLDILEIDNDIDFIFFIAKG